MTAQEHVNASEYWLEQANIDKMPNPLRTECLQLASIHALLASALAVLGEREDG